MAKMRKQIRAITFARIMGLIKHHEIVEKPNKLTLELRSDQSGCIRDDFKTNIVTWNNIDDFNDLIKESNYE